MRISTGLVHRLHRIGGSVAAFVTIIGFAALSGSCGAVGELRAECELGQVRCLNGVAEYCRKYLLGYGPARIWQGTRCRGESYCQIDGDGPFCTLTEEPDDRCVPDEETDNQYGSFCDGNLRTRCRNRFPIFETYCPLCSEGGPCEYVPYNNCNIGDPCKTEGLICSSRGHDRVCAPRCDCEEGIECLSCNRVGRDAESYWRCNAKRLCEGRRW